MPSSVMMLSAEVRSIWILLVAQGLRRRNYDRVAGVYADRVNVLHVTDGDGVALVVAHYLVLDFLPACDALLDQNLVNTRVT